MISMKDRFNDPEILIREIAAQRIIGGSREVAAVLCEHEESELLNFAPGAHLIHEQDSDTDCYFILAGKVDLVVGGDSLGYSRGPGEVVGEFAAINPKLKRTASVVAMDDVVALRCSPKTFLSVKDPEFWRRLATELTHKVEQRNALLAKINEKPKIFIIATESLSKEGDEMRRELASEFDVDVWKPEDMTEPGLSELEALRIQACSADFAIVLADPDDLLEDSVDASVSHSVRFELGFVMAELSPNRTVVIVPCQSKDETPKLLKGLQPMTYCIENEGMPIGVVLGEVLRRIREMVASRSVRTRFGVDRRS